MEVIIGLWARQPKDEKVEIMKAMRHYLNDPGGKLSPVATAIATGNHVRIDLENIERMITAMQA